MEFQHSHIDPHERRKREAFYKKMVWVADGTRLKRDYPRFLNAMKEFRPTNKQGIFQVHFPDECFPSAWLGSSVPVIFDFKGTEIMEANDRRTPLYYLFPNNNSQQAAVAIFHRESVIDSIITGEFLKDEVKKEPVQPPIKSGYRIQPRQSQFVIVRGKYVRRRRL